jgi:hypothetical protein
MNAGPDEHGHQPEESAMSALTKLSYPLAILATFAVAPAPAHAQFFEGAGNQMAQFAPMIEQFAPMMQRVTNKIGKKRMGQMMQMVAPIVVSMMPPDGDYSASPAGTPGMENIMSMMGDGPARRPGRRHK